MAENSIAPGQKHDSGTGTEIDIATVTLKYDNVLPPKNDEAYIRNMGFACFKTFSKITSVRVLKAAEGAESVNLCGRRCHGPYLILWGGRWQQVW